MLVDVSHVVEHGMVTYKGLPAPLVCDFLSREQSRSHYAPGTEFHIAKIQMVANTGTYLDSPFHRYANGKDLSELPLDRLANRAMTSGLKRSWCAPAGMRTGARTSISRATPS
jgi:kynurenine formamidase